MTRGPTPPLYLGHRWLIGRLVDCVASAEQKLEEELLLPGLLSLSKDHLLRVERLHVSNLLEELRALRKLRAERPGVRDRGISHHFRGSEGGG